MTELPWASRARDRGVGPAAATWVLLWPLGAPGPLWGLLVALAASWGLLGRPGGPWGLLGPPEAIWGLLKPPGASWSLLRPPGASWGFLGCSGASWRLLTPPGISGDSPGASWELFVHPRISQTFPGVPGVPWYHLGLCGASWNLLMFPQALSQTRACLLSLIYCSASRRDVPVATDTWIMRYTVQVAGGGRNARGCLTAMLQEARNSSQVRKQHTFRLHETLHYVSE